MPRTQFWLIFIQFAVICLGSKSALAEPQRCWTNMANQTCFYDIGIHSSPFCNCGPYLGLIVPDSSNIECKLLDARLERARKGVNVTVAKIDKILAVPGGGGGGSGGWNVPGFKVLSDYAVAYSPITAQAQASLVQYLALAQAQKCQL